MTSERRYKISVANSRFSKTWKNKEISWRDLIKSLQGTTRTHETVAEFAKMPKLQQDKIKDVGGFVGGWLKDGLRRTNTVANRSLITLDLDEATSETWTEFSMIYDNLSAICYSTHKHTPNKPRLRLVIPLDRDVTPEEYEAISRKLAESIGIDQFDDTTYQASRLMYWPSTSKDGEYFFQVQTGECLIADEYLSRYADWKDVRDWPVSSRQTEATKRHAEKAEDPFTKDGIIGAFCRAYPISAAIETFLDDIYTKGDRVDRYTYKGGSTSNGLVTYDDKFAYSNHSTDPASGKLCNSFDLVRIHKFGELDKEMGESNNAPSRLPSFKAMSNLTINDKGVKAELLDAKTEDSEWKLRFETNSKGTPLLTVANFSLIIANDTNLKDHIRMNELTHQPEAYRELPWDYVGQLRDEDDAQLKRYIELNYGIYHNSKLQEAVICEADDHKYHPIKDYLNSLSPWDGVPRVESLLIDYLGADDNEYVRAVTRKTLVSAVARILDPGCKFDYMLTLVGPQGVGKSSFIRALCGEWYIGLESGISGKESVEQLQGRWIVEVEELSSLKKAEVEQIKTYLSKQEEQVRMAYARHTGVFKRQNIFIGTTNNRNFLRDLTGNRRFWVVDITRGIKRLPNPDDAEACRKWREQIWAEALIRYQKGEKRYLDTPALESLSEEAQASHMEEDPWVSMIADYVERLLPENWEKMEIFDRRQWLQEGSNEGKIERERVCALEIWCECLNGRKETLSTYDANRINQILDRLGGWERNKNPLRFGRPYGQLRGFVRKE